MMRIGVAADHGGFALKETLVIELREAGYEVFDFGAHHAEHDDDYPDYIIPLARAVASGEVARGIALCGSGVGASIAANKIAGVRAGLIHDVFSAHQGVEDDDMNVFALGGQVIGDALARELIHTFLNARFSGAERHRRRVAKVAALEIPSLASTLDAITSSTRPFPETVEALSGGQRETFVLDWYARRWSSEREHEIAAFPFIATVVDKRYELYGDGTFNEEELGRAAAG
jgi:ribose 5-phosphate isomerase B